MAGGKGAFMMTEIHKESFKSMNRKEYTSPLNGFESLTLEKGILAGSDTVLLMGIESDGQQIDGYYDEDDLIVSEWE